MTLKTSLVTARAGDAGRGLDDPDLTDEITGSWTADDAPAGRRRLDDMQDPRRDPVNFLAWSAFFEQVLPRTDTALRKCRERCKARFAAATREVFGDELDSPPHQLREVAGSPGQHQDEALPYRESFKRGREAAHSLVDLAETLHQRPTPKTERAQQPLPQLFVGGDQLQELGASQPFEYGAGSDGDACSAR